MATSQESNEGFKLDAINDNVAKDERGGEQKPHFRTTGMKLTVDLHYSNLQGSDTALHVWEGPKRENVDASVKVRLDKGWAGPGPQVFYPQAPTTDADGVRTFEKMVRYRQGVEVVFRRFRIEGVGQKVIADELGVSLTTVEKDLQKAYRAMIALKQKMDTE